MVARKTPRKASPKNKHTVTADWIPVGASVLQVMLELQTSVYGDGSITYNANGITTGYSMRCKGRRSNIEACITQAVARLS